jgi:hypothetical protein
MYFYDGIVSHIYIYDGKVSRIDGATVTIILCLHVLICFVNKRVIYRLGIISLAHASVHTFKPGNKIIK